MPGAKFWQVIIQFLGYDPRPKPETLGEALRRFRGTRGIPQRRLAAELKVDHKTLRWWEQGVRIPEGSHLARVIGLLGADVLELLDSIDLHSVGGSLARAPNTIGQALIRYRAEQHLSQKQLAAALEVHPGTLAKWELEYRTPAGEFLARVNRMLCKSNGL